MTTVVAVQHKNSVQFASDSQITAGGNYAGVDKKIFTNGVVTFGFSGSVHSLNLMSYMKMPDYPVGTNPAEWLTNTLIPALQTLLKDGLAMEVTNGAGMTKNALILAIDGQAYYIGADFGWWTNPIGFYTVGSGSEIAMGALMAGATPEDAVRYSAQIDNGTGLPVKSFKAEKIKL